MKPLPKNYDHKEAEPRLQKRWEESRIHAWDDSQPRENTFVIDTPPPTVSGVLHMGHIFSYTQADFVARYQRMSGKTVFYPMGFDDNGLPTERLVEKIKEKKASQYASREEFIAVCKEVVKSAEEEFRRLFKSTALSVDWSQEYQTISADVRKLSQMSFLDLLQKGEAYRDFRPTYWDWVDQTAIAQAEIENKELPGTMNEIEFTLEDGSPLVIATTRPELLGACVAVMYHPEDPNAGKYEGKYAVTPVFGVKVPMIADELVERDKGTGLVMCCTFGDDTDKEWSRIHSLPWRPILGLDGKINVMRFEQNGSCIAISFKAAKDGKKGRATLEHANTLNLSKTSDTFTQVEGLKPKQANSKMLELLQAEGKLLKQTNITHTVKVAERSQTPIEIIPTNQWFVRITDKKDALKAKGKQCHWYPEFMKIRLDQWIDGLKEDWCISRQRFFGVPFPVWYSYDYDETKDEINTAHSEINWAPIDILPSDPITDFPEFWFPKTEFNWEKYKDGWIAKHKEDKSRQFYVVGDKDIMDTWATSSVSPQINARGITKDKCEDAKRFNLLFPADLRPQAHEIIRTWAFYTIVKAYLHNKDNPDPEKQIPWKNLMISGWCLAADKSKMSKSKGNVITPVELIIDKGADVVRYWASTSRLGADTAFSEDLLKIGKKLVTKLWNATAFAAIHLSKINGKPDVKNVTEALDKWILSRLHKTVAKATMEFERFEYSDARVAVEEFFWKDFCDNYLELVKARAYGEIGDAQAQASAHVTLYYCLNAILRLFAPFVPHVTEELFSHLFEEQGSVHARGMWPKAADYPDAAIEIQGCGKTSVRVLEAVRKAKSEQNVSIKFPIKELVLGKGSKGEAYKTIEPGLGDLKAAGNIESIVWSDDLKDGIETEEGWFSLKITFGEQADVA